MRTWRCVRSPRAMMDCEKDTDMEPCPMMSTPLPPSENPSPEIHEALSGGPTTRWCYAVCIAGGVLIGVGDALLANLLGYQVMFRGELAFGQQMAWHILMF